MSRSLVLSAALTLLVSACGAPPPITPAEPGKGSSLAAADPKLYPAGPFGYQEGEVIANLEFLGRADDNHNGTIVDDPIRRFSLSDIYQDKSIKALAILVAAEWCGPCQLEQFSLQKSYGDYQTAKSGVYYIEALIESDNAKRTPADIGTVDRWSSKKWANPANKTDAPLTITFPVVADPTIVLGPYYPYPAFPMQIAVSTKDMVIQQRNNGYAPTWVESAMDAILTP